MDIRTVAPDEPFSLEEFGFQITQGPPSPSGHNQYAPTPADKISLGTAGSTEVPPQTISFANDSPVNTANLAVLKQSGALNTHPDFIAVTDGFELSLQLTVDYPVDIEFTLTLASEIDNGVTTTLTFLIVVNGYTFVNGDPDQNDQWHNVNWFIPSTLLNAGANGIDVTIYTDTVSNIASCWLQSVSVSSQDVGVPIEASYYWREVFSGYAEPPGSEDKAISHQSGTDTSDSSVYSFAEQIGVDIQGQEGVPFEGISEKLSLAFAAARSLTHPITISESETDSYSVSITPTDGPVTFQFWQLCFEFDAGGQIINQLIKEPIIQTQYPPPSGNGASLKVVS